MVIDPGISDREIEAAIRQRIQRWRNKRKEFLTHLLVYLIANMALLGIWGKLALTGFPLTLWITFFWGIGLAIHAIDTYHHSPGYIAREEMSLRHEIEREKRRLGTTIGDDYEKPKRKQRPQVNKPTVSHEDPPMRLADDGELVLTDDESDQKPTSQKALRRE